MTEEDIEAAVAIWDSDNSKAVAVVHGDAFSRVVDTMPIRKCNHHILGLVCSDM